jgi:hypothetical protein
LPAIGGLEFTLVEFGQENAGHDISPCLLLERRPQQFARRMVRLGHLTVTIEHNDTARNGVQQLRLDFRPLLRRRPDAVDILVDLIDAGIELCR